MSSSETGTGVLKPDDAAEASDSHEAESVLSGSTDPNDPLLTPAATRQLVFWTSGLLVFGLFLSLFSSILLPFIAGMVLAYLLDPVADRLESIGASRLVATFVILLVFVICFVVALLVVVPVLSNQLATFIERLPGYVTLLQSQLTQIEMPWLRKLVGEGADNLRENLDELLTQGAGFMSTLVASIWNSGKALINVISLLVITPIVAFYLLLDFDRMVARIDSWLPRDHKADIEEIASDINGAIAGFVRGQGSVCLILGIFYAVGLSLAGLNFGLLIGMFAGLISFVPFVGSIVGLILSVGVALVQFWPDYLWIGMIAGIFFLGQFLEGNVLQPKLVGDSVGLHPVWLMFSLSAFGVLLGFTGLLIAVPVAAAIGVLVRFALRKYLASPLYLGHKPDAAANPYASGSADKPDTL
ncbi:MAG: AI-2E family transporter [Pseudomonadota bacterium]